MYAISVSHLGVHNKYSKQTVIRKPPFMIYILNNTDIFMSTSQWEILNIL